MDDLFGDIDVPDISERDFIENKPVELPRGRPAGLATASESSTHGPAKATSASSALSSNASFGHEGGLSISSTSRPLESRAGGVAGFAAAMLPGNSHVAFATRPSATTASAAASLPTGPGRRASDHPAALTGASESSSGSSAAAATSASGAPPARTAVGGLGGSSGGGVGGSSSGSSSSSSSGASGSSSGGRMVVSTRQKGNPIMGHIRHAWFDWSSDIKPDFLPNKGTAVLYLSLRYHALNPRYLLRRMRDIRPREYRLCALIVFTDVSDCERMLLEVQRTVILSDWTVFCASSVAEAARYIETFCVYENKPATAIQERVEEGYLPRAVEVLTTIRSINRRDVITLISRFQSLAGIMAASLADLQTCAGIAEKKARHLHEAFHKPLLAAASAATGAVSAGVSSASASAGGGTDSRGARGGVRVSDSTSVSISTDAIALQRLQELMDADAGDHEADADDDSSAVVLEDE